MPSDAYHQESLKRFYSNHPKELSRAHRAFLGGIADEAQAYMEENDLPHLAHHPEMENIRNLPKSEHLQAVKRLRAQESSGPDGEPENENYDTEEYLGDRAKRTPAHKRTPVERYR